MTAYSLTPITERDAEVLQHIYSSTRREELAAVPWSDEQKDAFLRQQFAAQHAHYQQHYEGATFDLIRVDGQTCGRLYVARWPAETRVIDIALLPEFRGAGLGARILGDLLAEAGAAGCSVTVHVERMNRALSFYERMGFSVAEDKGVYLFLRWTPATVDAVARA